MVALLSLQDAFSPWGWASVWTLIKLLGAHAQSRTSLISQTPAQPVWGLGAWVPVLLRRGLEQIVRMLTLACAMQASGLLASETGLGSEGLICWDGPKRGSAKVS